MVRSKLGVLSFAVAAACGAGSEPVEFSLVPTCLLAPMERVFASEPEWRQAHESQGREPVPEVDFGRSRVAVHVESGSACTSFSVSEVEREDGGRITIHATRHLSSDPCIAVLALPQLAVLLPRGDEPVSFRIEERTGGGGPAGACF